MTTESAAVRRISFLPRSIGGLAFAVAAATALVTAALGGLTYYVVHEEIERQIDHRIKIEMRALVEYERQHGFDALLHVIAIRDETGDTAARAFPDGNGADSTRTLGYMVFDAAGKRRGGMLRAKRPPAGWSEFVHFVRPDGSRGIAQAINAPLPDGGALVVAVDRLIVDEMDRMLFELFVAAFGTLMLVNVGATLIFGRSIRHRFRSMGHTAAAIMAGDMAQRMPLAGEDRDLDRLAGLLNDMLDRISVLVANLREISGGLAHDLRTPLARLRAKLERAESGAADAGQAELIRSALAEADALLELFAGILAIAEVDGRSARARFAPVDLGEATIAIAEAHRAALEDGGIALDITTEDGILVAGDRSLLQQLVANLLGNILVHAAGASRVTVTVEAAEDEAIMRVEDDGPGIPLAEHARIFERLVRLDASRSAPGHGLGLSMAAAIVAAHDGRIAAHPQTKGLAIEVRVPRAPPEHTGAARRSAAPR